MPKTALCRSGSPRARYVAARAAVSGRRRHLGAALLLGSLLLTAACAATTARPRPFPVPGGNAAKEAPSAGLPAPEPESSAADRPRPAPPYDELTATALSLRGVPYRNGGVAPDGFDCSGFVQYVFWRHGVMLPREVRQQYLEGTPVARERIEAGDLLFFSTVAPGPSHVGIALGGDRFVHAPSSTGVVRVEALRSRYWSGRFVGAKRLL